MATDTLDEFKDKYGKRKGFADWEQFMGYVPIRLHEKMEEAIIKDWKRETGQGPLKKV